MTEKKKLTRAHWMVLIAAFMGWMFDGLEMGLFPLIARPALQDLLQVTDEAAVGVWNGRLAFCFLLGAALGGLAFGWLGDKIGRVRAMMLSVLCYSFFTGCCYFAMAPWQLGGLRFLAALGMGGEWSLGVALVMEYWPEKLRPLMAGIIGAAANVGFLSIAVLAMYIRVDENSWRWMMIAGAAPAVLTIFIRLFVPESERWQESVKEKSSKPIREIFSPGLLKPTLLAICFASIALIGTWGAVSGFLPLWADKLAGGDRVLKVTAAVADADGVAVERALKQAQVTDDRPGDADTSASDDSGTETPKDGPDYAIKVTPKPANDKTEYTLKVTNKGNQDALGVKLTAALPLDTVDVATVSIDKPDAATFDVSTGKLSWTVGKVEYKNPYAKGTVQFMVSIGAIIGCIAGPLLGGRFGRRPAYFVLCLSSLLVCGFLFRALTEYNAMFLLASGLAGLTTASFYGWLPLYLPELFPTRVRATGQGLSFNFGRIAAAFAAMGTGVLMIYVGGSYPKAMAIVTLIYLVGMVLIWFAPETKGKPLPE